MELIGVGVISAVLSWAIILFFRRWATEKNKLLDNPNDRSLHTRPTPRGGGIGIILVALIFIVSERLFFFGGIGYPEHSIGIILPVYAGALLVIITSWLDDVRDGLSPAIRLAVHIAAAGLAIWALGGWSSLQTPFLGVIELGWLGTIAALVWIVGLINAYNFMDGIDGIAGVQALTAAAGWLLVGLLSGRLIVSLVAIVIGSAVLGFLVHNWPPASVFMGDVGSAFLGYTFAVLPLYAQRSAIGHEAERLPMAGVLMLSPFIADTAFTLIRRLMRRERLSQAHRSHLYQRLVLTGLSHRAVALIYMFLGLTGSAAAVSFVFLRDRLIADFVSILALAMILVVPLLLVLSRERGAARGARS